MLLYVNSLIKGSIFCEPVKEIDQKNGKKQFL